MSRALPCPDLSKGTSFSPVLRAFVTISLDIRFLVILSGALRLWFAVTHDIERYHSLGLILWVRGFFPPLRRKISCHVEAKNSTLIVSVLPAYPISFHRSCAGLTAQARCTAGKVRPRRASWDRQLSPQQHRKALNLNPVFAGDGDLG